MHIDVAQFETQVKLHMTDTLRVLNAPVVAHSVVAQVLLSSTSNHLWLQLHTQMAYHLIATGGVGHHPLKVKLVTSCLSISILNPFDELRNHRVFIPHIRLGKWWFLVFVEYAVQIVIKTMLTGY